MDMGYKGPPCTWTRGQLRDRLDRVLGNADWQVTFPQSAIINLPLPSSNHCGLWIRHDMNFRQERHGCFKFLSPWLGHPSFPKLVHSVWRPTSPWGKY